MPKIFISYARDGSYGEQLAAEVQNRLLAVGFEVFRDVIGLKPGDVWYHKLEFELESSDALVLVVSEKVRTSKWVHNEVSMAEEIGIPVIPVLAQRIRQPLWLRHLQLLDFCGEQHWEVLVEAVRAKAPSISSIKNMSAYQSEPQKDEQLNRTLQSIGKECFVKYYEAFTNPSKSNEELIELLMAEEGYAESGCKTRVLQSRNIINSGRAKVALKIIASSQRLPKHVIKQAHDLLSEHSTR